MIVCTDLLVYIEWDANMDDQDTVEFIRNSEDSWTDIYGGNAKAANKKIRAAEKIVERKAADGTARDFLSPLLSHQSAAVRYAAAAHIMNHGEKAGAIAVLRDLVVNDPTLISSSAECVLRIHEISKTG